MLEPGASSTRRHSRPTRVLWPALVAICLLLWAAGCGDDDPSHPACAPGALTYGCLQAAERAPIGETLAVNTHFSSNVDRAALAKLRAAGVRTLRNDLTWQDIEKTRGVHDFVSSGYDALVAAAEAEGLRFLFILDYGNYLYGGYPKAVVSDAGRAAFAAFAEAAAQRYGGRGHTWEIWNEPNSPSFWIGSRVRPNPEQYALLVQAAVPALRRADPNGKIVIGAVFYGDLTPAAMFGAIEAPEFLRRLAATGVFPSVDAVSAHFYRSEAPETVRSDVEAIRQIVRDGGADLPVWSGEWGYSAYDPNVPSTGYNFITAVSLERQASYIARMYLTNYLLGVPVSVYYQDLDAANPSPGNIEDHWGLYRSDLSDKPAYEAVFALNRLIGNVPSRGTLVLDAGEHGVVFDTQPQTTTVLWAEQEAQWRVSSHGSAVKVLSRDGRDQTPPGVAAGEGGEIHLLPDDGPIYLVGDIQLSRVSEAAR